jgi:hypothetical protein
MRRFCLFLLSVLVAFVLASCGVRLNRPVDADPSETVIGGKFGGEYKPETDEVTTPRKYSKYFDVVVSETEGGILYVPYTDDEGNETGDIIVVGYNGASLDVVIPPIIDGGNVRAISEGAFYGKNNIISITVPDSVTEIGRAAFSSCPNLTSVTFGRGVTELPPAILRNCRVLTSVTLPDTLAVIGDFAFEGCIMLENLYIPASVTEIGHDAFMTCERLTLDVSDNEYAAAYAEEFKINTDEYLSYSAFRRRVIAGIAAGIVIAAAAVGVPLYLRRRREVRS